MSEAFAVRSVARAAARIGVSVLLLGAGFPIALAAERPDLASIPEPVLEHFEERVRSQLRSVRSQVEAVFATPDATAEELAGGLGLLGQLYLLYDAMSASEACLREAHRLRPEDFRWPYYLAVLYGYEGRLDDGWRAIEAALAIEPNDLTALLRRGDFAWQRGAFDAASESYERALAIAPASSAARYGLGRVLARRGELAAAIALFEEALPGQPEGTVIHHDLGMAYRRLGEREKALEHLERNRHEPIVFPDPLFDLMFKYNVSLATQFKRGVEALDRGQPEQAVELFRGILEAKPDDPETHYNLAMALLDVGHKVEAEHHLRRAIELRETYRDPHFNVGRMLIERGEYQEAELHFRRASEIDPEDLPTRLRWAELLARLRRAPEALEQVALVLRRDPGLVEAHLVLAAIHLELEDAEQARAALERVLAFAPGAVKERSEAHFQLAVLEPSGSGARLEHLRAALELAPDLADARSLLAGDLAREGRYAEAADQFELVIERRPADLHAHFGQATALMLSQEYHGAARSLERAVESVPDSLALEHALARLLATCPAAEVRDG
ncbi:MAG TPA: tetratricopeptide repeat protein, partial [Thermoanaerobaculia bacterium]|nr:tetratricopeptide repeat protein [Thermoanaerobaculia bacterium]